MKENKTETSDKCDKISMKGIQIERVKSKKAKIKTTRRKESLKNIQESNKYNPLEHKIKKDTLKDECNMAKPWKIEGK